MINRMLGSVSLLVMLCVSMMPVYADTGFSVVKTISINHVGDPRKNDGIHKEAIAFRYGLDDTHAFSIGYFENSQRKDAFLLGYNYTYHKTPRYELTANLYLANNYDDTYVDLIPTVEFIPLLGLNWHLTSKIDFVMEGIPVPGSSPYVLLQTGLSYRF